MSQISFQQATTKDLDALQDLSKKTFYDAFAHQNTSENMRRFLEDGFSSQKLESELNNPSSFFQFIFLDGHKIGYCKLNIADAQSEDFGHTSVEIERIYILRPYLGQGFGQMVMDFALEFARDRQAEFIWLGVWEENKKAINFYSKNGFEAFDTHIFMVGNDPQTDILMKKNLS